MAVFRELRGVNVKFLFSNPEQAHLCAELRRLTYYAWKSVRGPWLWSVGKTQNKKQSKHFDVQFRPYGENETHWGIVIKFSMWVDILDVITCSNFGDDWLWGLGVAMGWIFYFHIDMRRRPHNSRTTVGVCDYNKLWYV